MNTSQNDIIVKRLNVAIESAVEDLATNGPDVVLEYILTVLRKIRDG